MSVWILLIPLSRATSPPRHAEPWLNEKLDRENNNGEEDLISSLYMSTKEIYLLDLWLPFERQKRINVFPKSGSHIMAFTGRLKPPFGIDTFYFSASDDAGKLSEAASQRGPGGRRRSPSWRRRGGNERWGTITISCKEEKKTWHFQKIRLFALWQVGGNIDPSAVFAAKYEATAGSGFSSTGLSRNTKNLKPRSFNPYHGRLTFLQPFFSVREIKAGKTTVFLVTTPPPKTICLRDLRKFHSIFLPHVAHRRLSEDNKWRRSTSRTQASNNLTFLFLVSPL